MYRVLIPTDFSDNAWNAIHYATSLYKGEETIFYLLNSYSPNTISPGEVMASSAATKTLFDAVKSASLEGLDKSIEEIMATRPDPGHAFRAVSRFDYFVNAVVDVCEEENIDMVVMGTMGASGLKEALIGSNTASLIGKIKVPLLAIPEDVKFRVPENIAFATDYGTEYREKNLQVFFHLADKFDAGIHVYHVMQKKEELSESHKAAKAKMEERFAGHRGEFYLLSETSLSTATRVFVQSRNIDMLCMVAKKHSFLHHLFGLSHTKDMCYHIDIPLLILQNDAG